MVHMQDSVHVTLATGRNQLTCINKTSSALNQSVLHFTKLFVTVSCTCSRIFELRQSQLSCWTGTAHQHGSSSIADRFSIIPAVHLAADYQATATSEMFYLNST